ncbi:hydroxyethylthiazole kinase [Desulfatibacillum aliphaticivorans]|uniref:hydroxyethylthiazole kinase n=1 Tax=Desulfatibacillum aliphaticivorans TaxID=218208 RepID=UPI00040D1CC2|nr:hydroxyethylthiazole kinase [Desulfatibacillum aliphaticivorans]
MNWNAHGAKILDMIRNSKPLVHHITNLVVMNDTANVTLHIGALPVMAHAVEEMEEMTSIAGALVINIGTLSKHWIEAMFKAGKTANDKGIPIILDPVGAGATSYRTETCHRLLEELSVSVIRGNLGEVSILAGLGGEVKGVESVSAGGDAVDVAKALAAKQNCTVSITGKEDVISDGTRTVLVDNGHEWLTTLTGTGCSSTTAVAAFSAVERIPVTAAACALMCYGLAAEIAAPQAKGPASFKVAFYDALYNLNAEQIEKGGRVREVS